MVKVRFLSSVTAAGAAALHLTSLAGCSADDATQDQVGTGTENNTEAVAGSGTVTLHSYALHYSSTSGGDEFLRVGEKMTVAVDFNDVLDTIAYQYDPSQAALRADLKANPDKIKLALKATYTKFDEAKIAAPELAMPWAPGSGGVPFGKSPELTIPAGTKLLTIEIVATYDKAGVPTTVELIRGQGIPNEFVVFGAFAPNKLALFDTVGAERRTRVVEGGAIIKGSHAVLSYTDWRLDTVTDKVSMDLRIGKKNSGSRFGPVVIDALGSIEYEVSAAVSTDGGATYNPVNLTKAMRPAVFARSEGWRYAFETELGIPANAGPSVKVAFHVKAFLQVPSYYPGEIQDARYSPGQRILLRDVWDNNDGRDYALPIAANQ